MMEIKFCDTNHAPGNNNEFQIFDRAAYLESGAQKMKTNIQAWRSEDQKKTYDR